MTHVTGPAREGRPCRLCGRNILPREPYSEGEGWNIKSEGEAKMTAATEVSRLCKSRSDRMIDGVCGGISHYIGVDSTLVRLGFVFLAFLGGLGAFLYVAAMIIMPVGNGAPAVTGPKDHGKVLGIVLVALGTLLLLGKVGFSFWHGWWQLPWGVVIPAAFIAGGIALIVAASKNGSERADARGGLGEPVGPGIGTSRLYRSRAEKKLFGVCGGIGLYLNTDPTLVRILFILAALASAGLIILLYVILALVVPVEPGAASAPVSAAPGGEAMASSADTQKQGN